MSGLQHVITFQSDYNKVFENWVWKQLSINNDGSHRLGINNPNSITTFIN